MDTAAKGKQWSPIPMVKNVQPNYKPVLTAISDKLSNVSNVLELQGVKTIVPTYDGKPENFRGWVENVEKYNALTNVNQNNCKKVAFQTSQGPCSGFIRRYMSDNPDCSWDQMKTELSKRFSDVADGSLALRMLYQIRQNPGENVQSYAGRILSLAEIGFAGEDNATVRVQLVDIFVNGLTDEQLKLTILRKEPVTLNDAVIIATNERIIQQRVKISSHDATEPKFKPYGVPHVRESKYCGRGKLGHRAPDNKNVNAVGREIRCWGCNSTGHIFRNCGDENNAPKTEKNRVNTRVCRRPRALKQGN